MYLGKFMYISTECSNMATQDMEKKIILLQKTEEDVTVMDVIDRSDLRQQLLWIRRGQHFTELHNSAPTVYAGLRCNTAFIILNV